MKESILNFLDSVDSEDYPLAEMREELTSESEVFLSEIAVEFERAVAKAKRLKDKNFPMVTAANALSTFIANAIAFNEETDEKVRDNLVMNCLDASRQLWNIARHTNKK